MDITTTQLTNAQQTMESCNRELQHIGDVSKELRAQITEVKGNLEVRVQEKKDVKETIMQREEERMHNALEDSSMEWQNRWDELEFNLPTTKLQFEKLLDEADI